MNIFDMDVPKYCKDAVSLAVIIAAIDREMNHQGIGDFMSEVFGCDKNQKGQLGKDNTESFLLKWQNLALNGPHADSYIQSLPPEDVKYFREKYADLMESYFAERAEDYDDELGSELFYSAIAAFSYEAGYLDFDALSSSNKEKYNEAKKKHDYLAQFEQYKNLAQLEEKISELLPELKSALEEYTDTFNSIENFDGDLDAIKSMVGHWANEFYYIMRDAESLKDSVVEIASKD